MKRTRKKHSAAFKAKVALAAIRATGPSPSWRCILHYPYAPSPDEWQFLDADGNPVVARISGSLISSSSETTHAAAMAGIGLILTSPFLVADLIASGALVPLLPGYRAQQLEINALYPHRRHLSAKVRAFIDMLVDRFAEQQRWLDAKIEQ
jgi:DNA-binding transcriptional LysR family regulator